MTIQKLTKKILNKIKKLSQPQKAKELFDRTQKIRYLTNEVNTKMFDVAQELYIIKKSKLFRYWDINEKPKWGVFLANSDIPLTFNAADKWIRVYKKFVLELEYSPEELAEITFRKLFMLLPLKEKINDEWVEMAKQLSQSDLSKMINVKLGKQKEEMQCCHHSIQKRWYCKECKGQFRKNPCEPGL